MIKVQTKNGVEEMEILSMPFFKDLEFKKINKGKKVFEYAIDFITFDTETSHYGLEKSWVYQWAFYFNGKICAGRKVSEFINCLVKIKEHYSLNNRRKIIIYVHNLSYDYQYIKRFLYDYDNNMTVLALDKHSILQIDVTGFRFLCSYKLSGLSLDLFAKTYAEKYVKRTGLVDYDIIRYQDTELSKEDWEYMACDVLSQYDAIYHYLKTKGYDCSCDAPITSTGFVRTKCRKQSKKDDKWRKEFLKGELTLEQYRQLAQSFMGGVCIVNYDYAGKTVENVKHLDFTSSYPARQMIDYFPEGKPEAYGKIESEQEFKYLIKKYCCCFICIFKNISLKKGITFPYIPSSKAIYKKELLKINGKVVYAEELHMAMTEIDYNIIAKQYDWESVEIKNMMLFKRGDIPDWMKETIMELFGNKCNLKNSDYKLYMASKAELNGIYGMTATKIIRDEYELSDCILNKKEVRVGEESYKLEKYYKSRNSFLPYQYGVWTTAHARKALYEMIEAVGYGNAIYCDTDSVFYFPTEETERSIKKLNKKIEKRAKECGAYIRDKVLGKAEYENDILKFRALHAKCYAYVDETGLNVTIAGIPKIKVKNVDGEKVIISNADELRDIDNLKDGFIFKECGGTRTIYDDGYTRIETINGHDIEISSFALIVPIEKEISGTMNIMDERKILLHLQQTG